MKKVSILLVLFSLLVSCAFAQVTPPVVDTTKAIVTVTEPAVIEVVEEVNSLGVLPIETDSLLMVYILAIAGVLIHLFMKYFDSYTKKETFDIKGHSMFAGASAVFIVILIYCFNFIPAEMLPFKALNPFTAFLMGYIADSLLKNISKFTGKKVE